MVRSRKVKKVKFSNIFLKTKNVSDAEFPQESNGTISFPVSGLKLPKNAFEVITSLLGTMGKIKTSLLGFKNIVSS